MTAKPGLEADETGVGTSDPLIASPGLLPRSSCLSLDGNFGTPHVSKQRASRAQSEQDRVSRAVSAAPGRRYHHYRLFGRGAFLLLHNGQSPADGAVGVVSRHGRVGRLRTVRMRIGGPSGVDGDAHGPPPWRGSAEWAWLTSFATYRPRIARRLSPVGPRLGATGDTSRGRAPSGVRTRRGPAFPRR